MGFPVGLCLCGLKCNLILVMLTSRFLSVGTRKDVISLFNFMVVLRIN